MLHRDVSVNNIMWEIRDGQLNFEMIDFDQATTLAGPGESYRISSKYRTGTLPFMSYELIQDAWNATRASDLETFRAIPHLLRHDFCSVLLVSLWCAELYPIQDLDKKHLDNLVSRARSLERGELEALANQKKKICSSMLSKAQIVLPSTAQCLEHYFDTWTRVFSRLNFAMDMYLRETERAIRLGRPLPEFDMETGNGIISRDKLKDLLNPEMPTQRWTAEELLELEDIRATEVDSNKLSGFLPPLLHRKSEGNKKQPVVQNSTRAKLRPRKSHQL